MSATLFSALVVATLADCHGLDYELVRAQCARFRRGEHIYVGEAARPSPDLGLAPEVFYAFQAPRDRPEGAGAA